jgi:tetratricopeptide (TPR) repeat protein
VLGSTAVDSSSLPWSVVLLTAPKILAINLSHMILPLGLSPQYDVRLVESPASGGFLLPLLILILLASLAFVATKREPRLWIALAWLLFPMLPALNLRWMNEDDFVHDRYTYLSMLGFALLAAAAYSWIRSKWPALQLMRPLAACLVLTLAFASAIQCQYWANDVILFSRAVSRAPGNEWAQLNYGSALSARGKYAQAAPYFVQSYELKPGWRAADFAAFSYQQSGELARAEQWFNTALQVDPGLANAWFGLGQIRLSQHIPAEAVPYLKKALEIEPTGEGYHYELATALEQLSQTAAAIEEYRVELRLHPYQTGARTALDRLKAADLPVN